MLHGRRDECAVLDRLLDGTRSGRSGALVLEGEAGVGKTALLDYAIGSASDLSVLRAVGVESEMELAFAALYQLCAPVLDRRRAGACPPGRRDLPSLLRVSPGVNATRGSASPRPATDGCNAGPLVTTAQHHEGSQRIVPGVTLVSPRQRSRPAVLWLAVIPQVSRASAGPCWWREARACRRGAGHAFRVRFIATSHGSSAGGPQ